MNLAERYSFSNWKVHDCYQPAFERLVRDLKREPDQQHR